MMGPQSWVLALWRLAGGNPVVLGCVAGYPAHEGVSTLHVGLVPDRQMFWNTKAS